MHILEDAKSRHILSVDIGVSRQKELHFLDVLLNLLGRDKLQTEASDVSGVTDHYVVEVISDGGGVVDHSYLIVERVALFILEVVPTLYAQFHKCFLAVLP